MKIVILITALFVSFNGSALAAKSIKRNVEKRSDTVIIIEGGGGGHGHSGSWCRSWDWNGRCKK